MNGRTHVDLMETLLEPGALEYVFQPIFELEGTAAHPHYLEALTRGPARTNLRSASVLFDYVERKGRAAEFDRLCVAGALRSAARLAPTRLGLNVRSKTLERDTSFVDFLLSGISSHGFEPGDVTLEMIEPAPRWTERRFRRATAALREAGVRLAVDDVGLGCASFRVMLECRPDYLKIDSFVIRGCHEDAGRAATVEAIALLASRLGARVVAEGVEDEADLALLQSYGIDLVQGELFAEPRPITHLVTRVA